MTAGGAWRRAGAALVAGLFALCAWRAATQAISHDEAVTWLSYLDGPLSGVFEGWRANNHVLHSLLAWFSVHAFGTSELSLRLPALLGAALYLLAARRLSRRLFGDGRLHLLALLLLAANPLVLDLLVAARGYGLALALMLWAALLLLATIERVARGGEAGAGALVGASLLLGACATASLSYAPAALGLLLPALPLLRARPAQAACLLLPGAALACALLLPAMIGVPREAFIAGVDDPLALIDTVVLGSLAHHDAPWLPASRGRFAEDVLVPAFRVLALLLLASLVPHLVALLAGRPARDAAERALRLLGGALVLSLGGLLAAHQVTGLLVPTDRGALEFLPLAVLCALLLARTGLRTRWRPLAVTVLAVLCGMAALHLLSLQASRFGLWPMDSGVRRLLAVMEERQALIPRRDVQVRVAHRLLAPPWQFYQRTRAASWMAPVPAEWDRSDLALDYLVVPMGDWGKVLAGDPQRFRLLAEDWASGLRVALPRRRGR